MPLRQKILIVFLVFAIVPFVLVFAYYDQSTQRTVQDKVGQMAVQTVEQNTIALNDRIRMMEKALLSASTNTAILDMLLPADYESLGLGQRNLDEMKYFFNSIIYTNNYIKTIRIDLYDPSADGKDSTILIGAGANDNFSPLTSERYQRYFRDKGFRASEKLPEFRDSDIYRQVLEQNGDMVWAYGILPDDDNLYIFKQFSYLSYSRKLGIITFVVKPELLRELTQDSDAWHQYVFDQKQQLLSGQADAAIRNLLESDLMPVPGDSREMDGLLLTSQDLVNGWSYVHSVSIPTLMADITRARGTILTLAFLILMLLVLTVSLLIRHFDRQLQVLVKKFESVEQGDLTIRQHLNTKDELGQLDHHFDHMVEQLQQLIRNNYISQLEKREAQLDALKFQINPHFLYNTLNVISSIATIHRAPSIPAICQNLSQLFRYNMSGHSNVTLKQELDSVRSFISLQQIQFAKPFQVYFDFETGVESCSVQKFILQPVVENAIKYGFASKDRVYCLEINAHADGDKLVIEVADDGAGIEPEDLERIRSLLAQVDQAGAPRMVQAKAGKNSIGLTNILERLRLAYGEAGSLQVQSESGSGTTVTLTMPLKEREIHG